MGSCSGGLCSTGLCLHGSQDPIMRRGRHALDDVNNAAHRQLVLKELILHLVPFNCKHVDSQDASHLGVTEN